MREHFFGRDPRTKEMVKNWTDEQLWELKRGGHDYRKVYAAYKAAMDHTGQRPSSSPTPSRATPSARTSPGVTRRTR